MTGERARKHLPPAEPLLPAAKLYGEYVPGFSTEC